jgi:hypothetical protein
MAYKVYAKGNYLILQDTITNEFFEDAKANVLVRKLLVADTSYSFTFKGGTPQINNVALSDLKQFDGTAWASAAAFETFIFSNTGFNPVSQEQLTDVQTALNNLQVQSGLSSFNLDPVLSTQNNPQTPNVGDRYLVGLTPTGVWLGKENYLAEGNGTGWIFTTPLNDMIIVDTSTDITFRYNGTLWLQWGASSILHNGNRLAATMTIGTNDNFGVTFKTNNSTRVSIGTTTIINYLVTRFNSETASSLVYLDASKNLKSLSTATYPDITELSYLKGATSSVQSQLNAKSPLNVTLERKTSSLVYLDASKNLKSLSTATYPDITELSYLKGATSSVQSQLNAKSPLNVTLERKTSSYTLVASDNTKLIEMNVATANTLTINTGLFSAGNQVLISQYGAGQTSFVAGAGMTLRSDGGKLKIGTQYSLATLIFISATEAYITGNLIL